MRNRDPHHIAERDEHGSIEPIENIPLAQRLKATELLGKSEADFTENLAVNGNITVTIKGSIAWTSRPTGPNLPSITAILWLNIPRHKFLVSDQGRFREAWSRSAFKTKSVTI